MERGLRALEMLVEAPQPPTHAELARKLDIPKSTLTQILESLQKAGFIGIEDRHYLPGVRLLLLGQRIAHSSEVRTAARPVMEHLALETGETVLLGTMLGNTLTYVEQAPSPQPIRYVTRPGEPRPLHCTAAGRLLMALNGRDPRSLGPLTRFTARTVTDLETLDQILEQIRLAGYATNIGESVPDVSAIAVPLRRGEAPPTAALTVTGPSQRLDDMETRVLPLLLKAAKQIELGQALV